MHPARSLGRGAGRCGSPQTSPAAAIARYRVGLKPKPRLAAWEIVIRVMSATYLWSQYTPTVRYSSTMISAASAIATRWSLRSVFIASRACQRSALSMVSEALAKALVALWSGPSVTEFCLKRLLVP